MNPALNSQRLFLLFGGAVVVISALLLVVYLLQRSLGRKFKSAGPKPARVHLDDEPAFTLATVNSVMTQLKNDQKSSQEKLVVAERRADESTRKFELLAREIDYGLMVFDTEGFVSFSNPLARKLLGVDTWSKRRYEETFQYLPDLSSIIGVCFRAGVETRKRAFKVSGMDGKERVVEASVLPSHDRSGALEFVVCLVREAPTPAPES